MNTSAHLTHETVKKKKKKRKPRLQDIDMEFLGSHFLLVSLKTQARRRIHYFQPKKNRISRTSSHKTQDNRSIVFKCVSPQALWSELLPALGVQSRPWPPPHKTHKRREQRCGNIDFEWHFYNPPQNWCFWTVVLEETLKSLLDCEEIQPVNAKGNQYWIFIGRTDAEAESPILWPSDAKNWLIGKDPDAGKDWRWGEKGMTEDEMVGWHHWLNGHEFE